SDAVLDVRIACLEHARVELGALALASSRADDLSTALAAADRLAPVERCADLDADAVGPPQPDDPLHAAAIMPVREAIALTRALDNAGELADALTTGNDAIARARELDWAPLRAEALEVVGEVEASRGEYAAAEALLSEAFFEARESGHDVVAVNAASTLVWVVGYRLARRAEGHEWARHGEAQLGSPAIGRLDEARLRNAIGTMYEDEGELDASEAAYRQALALIAAERGVDHSDAAMVHNNLGNLAERRGDFVKAEQEQRHALAINERVHGEDHELTAMSLNNLAIALQRQGRAQEGLPLLRRALAVRERVLGPEHPLVARTHMNLGVTLKALDELDEAEQHQRRAVAIFEAKLGGSHTDLASAWINLGNVLRRRGRGEDALAAIRRARTIFEAALPADHPNVARVKQTEAEFAADLAQ
ncbi:MAG TPA: tetratricopeptide repeat protein, partial [Nannocystaceae bacterium]|nr:tetratricopeptide repeat protein [Nannocystaceae bacterium]